MKPILNYLFQLYKFRKLLITPSVRKDAIHLREDHSVSETIDNNHLISIIDVDSQIRADF